MSLIHYWAEINTGGRIPTTSGTVYVRVQDLYEAVYEEYGSDETFSFNIKTWKYDYTPTVSGLKSHSIIYISGVAIGTGYQIERRFATAPAGVLASSEGWTDYVASNAVKLS